MKLIQRNMAQIIALCEKYKVKQLNIFGSVLTNRFNKNSDIDFTVIFDKPDIGDYFTNYFDLKFALEDLLKRDIDLVEYEAIRNPYFKEEVDETQQRIYG
jgi:predicted nucleotidyltransferase